MSKDPKTGESLRASYNRDAASGNMRYYYDPVEAARGGATIGQDAKGGQITYSLATTANYDDTFGKPVHVGKLDFVRDIAPTDHMRHYYFSPEDDALLGAVQAEVDGRQIRYTAVFSEYMDEKDYIGGKYVTSAYDSEVTIIDAPDISGKVVKSKKTPEDDDGPKTIRSMPAPPPR